MGAGGRDMDKEAQGEQTSLPPAYQEKEPLPPDNPDPEAPALGTGHEPPVIIQNHPKCKKNKGFRCCLCCCGVLTMLILCCTVLPVIIVYLTRDFWTRPYVDITFHGSSSRVTSQTLKRGNDVTIKCHVDLSSRYVPLVQWFHDPNEDTDDGRRGYRMFGAHNQIHDPVYKGRFQVVKTETASHQIIYKLKIKDLQPEDAGRYACQVPKISRNGAESVDEYQSRSQSSSSSSSEDRDGRGYDDDNDHHDGDKRHGCWWSHRRNDYIYIGVTK